MDKFRAEQVISDCKLALSRFDDELIADEFRLNLVLCLALLRAVGHCLQNEFRNDDIIFNKKKNDKIFTDFIKKFRDKILKNYSSNVGWEMVSVVGSNTYIIHYIITEGSYKGKDIRDVITEAINCWEQYIFELNQEKYTLQPLIDTEETISDLAQPFLY
jgi:hypothetical protein